jgi:hypothetical protein
MNQDNNNMTLGIRQAGETRGKKLVYVPNYTNEEIRQIANGDKKLYHKIRAQVRYRYSSVTKNCQRKASDRYILKRKREILDKNKRKLKFAELQQILVPTIEKQIKLNSILRKLGIHEKLNL